MRNPKKRQIENLGKTMNILKHLKISLKALPHLYEMLDLNRNKDKFFEIQQTFLSFGIITIGQLNFPILKKIVDKLKFGNLSLLINYFSRRPCKMLFLPETFGNLGRIFKIDSFERNPIFIKLLKFTTRCLVNSSWNIKLFCPKKTYRTECCSRINFNDHDLIYFEKIQNFFQEILVNMGKFEAI